MWSRSETARGYLKHSGLARFPCTDQFGLRGHAAKFELLWVSMGTSKVLAMFEAGYVPAHRGTEYVAHVRIGVISAGGVVP